MRLRKKWWARPELNQSLYFIQQPLTMKAKWQKEFNNDNPIHLELGCGWGRFINEKAEKNKDINYLGIDLKDEVLVYALRRIEENGLKNIRLTAMNIMFIEELFDKEDVSKIYINFCNPWPKLRHNKRRLTHNTFLKRYKNILKSNGEIWFKTDDRGLFEDSINYFKEECFDIKYITYDLHESDFKENVCTEYEAKFSSKGMKIMFLIAVLKKQD